MKSDAHKTLTSSIDKEQEKFLVANALYDKNKNNIHTNRSEAVRLYMLGFDCTSIIKKHN